MKRCKCHGKRFCVWAIVQTLAFPLEHKVWHMPGLRSVATAMGIG